MFFARRMVVRSWSRRYSGHCTVLVLIGSRLFAPTFLLRLTTHERSSRIEPRPDHMTLLIMTSGDGGTNPSSATPISVMRIRWDFLMSANMLVWERGGVKSLAKKKEKILFIRKLDLGLCIYVVGK